MRYVGKVIADTNSHFKIESAQTSAFRRAYTFVDVFRVAAQDRMSAALEEFRVGPFHSLECVAFSHDISDFTATSLILRSIQFMSHLHNIQLKKNTTQIVHIPCLVLVGTP
ncbi:hypothetical protein F2P81_010507 [Scophthalmus maximus]|uniref:Uncharacterized protein n=1 Tax=Scophthalmus maximus TaxID=52904 RepID=A0A6A4SUJ2_SCOMX|nr:hypothetical protein F2P81_010507 [Scophthalmus maximus]